MLAAGHSMGRLMYGTIIGDERDCHGACGECAACAVRATQSRIAQYLLTAMYLGSALWVVIHG